MERIAFETILQFWRSTPGGAASGIIRIIGEPADAIRLAGAHRAMVRRHEEEPQVGARHLDHRQHTLEELRLSDAESGGWVMPVNQATRIAEGLLEGDRIRVVIEL